MSFFNCREDDKVAVLIHLLKNVINQSEQTVVFAATKHHVEYLQMVKILYIEYSFEILLHIVNSTANIIEEK